MGANRKKKLSKIILLGIADFFLIYKEKRLKNFADELINCIYFIIV